MKDPEPRYASGSESRVGERRSHAAGESPRAIIHVDLDAFFASVEVLLNPALKGKAVIVGALPGHRGVVTAASYEARKYGVHSAMPISQAAGLCPHAVFVPNRHGIYREYSHKVMALLGEYTPLLEQTSIDEAYLDVTGCEALFGDAATIGRTIQGRVGDEIGLPCSLGVGSTKLVAKIASAAAKPAGIIVVPAGEEAEFLAPLPVDVVWGVGPKTAARLRRVGVERVGQLAEMSMSSLQQLFGRHAESYRTLARGGSDSPVEPWHQPKQVSHEETFDHDVAEAETLRRRLLYLADAVARRLRRHELVARTVTLKLRYEDFTTLTRSATLPQPTDLAQPLHQTALQLLEKVWRGRRVRLLGIAAGNLAEGTVQQPALFDAAGPKREQLARTIDALQVRFGERAVRRASDAR